MGWRWATRLRVPGLGFSLRLLDPCREIPNPSPQKPKPSPRIRSPIGGKVLKCYLLAKGAGQGWGGSRVWGFSGFRNARSTVEARKLEHSFRRISASIPCTLP